MKPRVAGLICLTTILNRIMDESTKLNSAIERN
jgi:hypothetical protein